MKFLFRKISLTRNLSVDGPPLELLVIRPVFEYNDNEFSEKPATRQIITLLNETVWRLSYFHFYIDTG